jgi:opacity protein-like surface antigen
MNKLKKLGILTTIGLILSVTPITAEAQTDIALGTEIKLYAKARVSQRQQKPISRYQRWALENVNTCFSLGFYQRLVSTDVLLDGPTFGIPIIIDASKPEIGFKVGSEMGKKLRFVMFITYKFPIGSKEEYFRTNLFLGPKYNYEMTKIRLNASAGFAMNMVDGRKHPFANLLGSTYSTYTNNFGIGWNVGADFALTNKMALSVKVGGNHASTSKTLRNTLGTTGEYNIKTMPPNVGLSGYIRLLSALIGPYS